jgi:hypothetical protein
LGLVVFPISFFLISCALGMMGMGSPAKFPFGFTILLQLLASPARLLRIYEIQEGALEEEEEEEDWRRIGGGRGGGSFQEEEEWWWRGKRRRELPEKN